MLCVCSQAKVAKACLRLDGINITVVPDKVGNPNGMQMSFEDKGLMRNLFVYAETPQVTEFSHHFNGLFPGEPGLAGVH